MSERGEPDLELKEMRPGIVGHRVFGAPVDVDAPPTPFALGPEIDGADFDLRGRGLGETDSEGLPDMRHSAVQRGK